MNKRANGKCRKNNSGQFTSNGKKGQFRKRSTAIHEKQVLLDLWNSDSAAIQTVDIVALKKATILDLYEDVGQHYEKLEEPITPFYCLHFEEKEEFMKDMKNLEQTMKKRNELNISDSSINKPLTVGNLHRHERLKIPSTHPYLFTRSPAAIIRDTKSNPYLDKEDDFELELLLLDEQRQNHLMRLNKYDLWEEFILPINLSIKRKGIKYKINLENWNKNIFENGRGLEIAFLELIELENQKCKSLLIAIKLDERDVFYVCVIFSLLQQEDFIPQSLLKNKSIVLNIDYTETHLKQELERINKMPLEFSNYFYFTCGCEK